MIQAYKFRVCQEAMSGGTFLGKSKQECTHSANIQMHTPIPHMHARSVIYGETSEGRARVL